MILLLLYVFPAFFIGLRADNMLGPGIWSMISMGECVEPLIREDMKLEVNKHKLNRTHDGLTAKATLTATIDDQYGALIEVCKYVDGGCKQYQIISDNSVMSMLYKYAEEMVNDALTSANIDPPEFPVSEGEYEVEDYIVDYCKLPREAVYGKFEALAYLILSSQKVACVKLVLEFNKFEDDNFCDE